jgi:glycosyltransferase involved in cell wall biosynthesis
MKILCVVEDFPWPARGGAHLRSQQVITSLAAVGELDLFSLTYPNRPDPCDLPPDVGVARLEVTVSPKPVYSVGRRLGWLVARSLPLEVVASQSSALRARFESWVAESYDVVWINRASTFELLGRPDLGRTIVDLVDLEDQKIRTRLGAMRAQPVIGGVRGRIHRQFARLQAERNALRWTRFQRSVARTVDTVVVCSQDDFELADFSNSTVVPNGYEPPVHPLGRIKVGDPPIVLFQGGMHYGPNTDGARWFVTEIAPLIRAHLPNVQVRLVGDPDGVVRLLDHPPEVVVVGVVESMEGELARADVAIAPLRYASGTRLKILESLAHRIPVISTTIGAQGLGLEPGRDLLVADDAEGFALACVSALTDLSMRERLVADGQAAFLEHHQWSNARERIRATVLASPAQTSRGRGHT